MATTVPNATPQPRVIWRYGNVAVALHWSMALLIVGQLILGIYFHELPPTPEKGDLFQIHRTLGLVILALALFRIGWRLTHRPPPYPVEMPRWERVAGVWNHRLFYAAMLAMLLTGLALVGLDTPWSDVAGAGHQLIAIGLIGLLALHVAAALKHQFWDRYETSGRMPPFATRTEPTRPAN